MAPKLVRCIEGHVFDAERLAACPVCGAAAPQQPVSQPASKPARTGDVPSGGTNSGDKAAPLSSLPRVSPRLVGGGAAALALVIFAGYWAHHHDDVPAASPPVAQKDVGGPKSPASPESPAEQKPQPSAENTDASQHKKIHINPDAIRHDDTATPPNAPPSSKPDLRDAGVLNAEERLGLAPLTRELLAAARARRFMNLKQDVSAKAWAQAPAAAGNPMANYVLGRLLLLGAAGDVNAAEGVRLVTQAGSAGFFPAEKLLGDLYAGGDAGFGIPADTAQANNWYQKVLLDCPADLTQQLAARGFKSELATERADFDLAQKNNDYPRAFALAQKLAPLGSSGAVSWLAHAISDGLGTEKNIEKGRELAIQSARLNGPNSIVLVGDLMKEGTIQGGGNNDELVLKLWARSVFLAQGQSDMSSIDSRVSTLTAGLSEQDYEALRSVLDGIADVPARKDRKAEAAPTPIPAPQAPQASTSSSDRPKVSYPPPEVAKARADLHLSSTVVDLAQYKRYWTDFAAKPDSSSVDMLEAVTLFGGISHGAFTLFEAYSRGLGVNKDYDAAVKFLRMAADQHNTIALTTLGSLTQFGRLGVPQNTDAAREFYRQAARQGSDEALEKFTALGGDPKSIKPTSPELIEWALQKKRSVVEPAMKASAEKVLGADCALAIYSIQTNNKKATPILIELLEQEARLGVGDASVYLAQIYEGGFGIDANPAEALAWNGLIYSDLTDADLKKGVEDTINMLAKKIDPTDFDSLTFVEPWLGHFKPGVLR